LPLKKRKLNHLTRGIGVLKGSKTEVGKRKGLGKALFVSVNSREGNGIQICEGGLQTFEKDLGKRKQGSKKRG